MPHMPLLFDIQSQVKFVAGDRVLVRVACTLSAEQHHRIYQNVKAYCRADINLLIVDVRYFLVTVHHPAGGYVLCGPTEEVKPVLGRLNLSCVKVEFDELAKVVVQMPAKNDYVERRFKEWVGTGNETEFVVKVPE